MTQTALIGHLVHRIRRRLCFARSDHLGVQLRRHALASDTGAQTVREALDLIHRIAPEKISAMRTCLPGGIAIEWTDYANGWFDAATGTCCLGGQFVATAGPVDLALTVVHELCHARLERCGIGYPEDQRDRIERLCVSREIAFARALARAGCGDAITVDALCRKRDSLTAAQFSDTALRALHRREVLHRARMLGMQTPHCVRRCLVLATRKRLRRLRQG
ncbi:MAG: hypothetical protein AAGA28_15925 [Pseudomonadota bacterium]